MRLRKSELFSKLEYTPHSGQVEIHKSRAPRRVVACGVRWGKTVASAMEGIAAAMEPRERSIGWVVAPTYDLADRVFREIQLVAYKHLRHRIITHREHERRIVFRNMGGGISEVRGKTADNPVSLLGEGLDWLIVDEAARLKPTIWQSHLSQRLIDKRGWALLISTPKGKGYFFDLWKRGRGNDADYQSWNKPSWTNPLLDADVIEEERSRLPERVFQQEYGAVFTEGAGAVFRNVRECATGTFQEPVRNETYYAGLDLARIEDFTVLVIVNARREVVYVDRFNKIDWSTQVGRIKVAFERYHQPTMHIDSTGKGEPIHEALSHEGVYSTGYPFTARSKAALMDSLALAFEKKAITIPKPELWPEGIDELESFEFSVSDSGNVRTSAPGGQHDDCVCALALAVWPIQHGGGLPRVVRFGRRSRRGL